MTTQINTTKLTKSELWELHECETVISKGKAAFVEVGQALLKIREGRLYREVGTFEDYCQMKWGFSRARGHQLVQHALTIAETLETLKPQPNLATIVDKMPEGQSRELAKVPIGQRAEVLENASKDGHVTAKSISTAAKSVKEPDLILDETGFVIPNPSPAMECWTRSQEVQDLLTAISHVRSTVAKAQERKDKLFSGINFTSVLSQLSSAYTHLKAGIPFAVCPTCQGRALSPCRTCNSRGTVSEPFWKTAVPQETKDIRAKSISLKKERK